MMLPHRQQVDWVGFSIKNPFPKNILVCASHAHQANKDEVGDLNKLIDFGLAPEDPSALVPQSGQPGGSIGLDLRGRPDHHPLHGALLLAMGGDGSRGRDGQSSPLCQKNGYQSFKFALSHHKEWFQRWLQFTSTHPEFRMVAREQYGDHWYGLFEINLPRTSGSDAGDAGAGGVIQVKHENTLNDAKPSRWFLSAGIAGLGGKSGTCGPNDVHPGKDGRPAANGIIKMTNN
jgi:hypothetical protein